MKKLIDRFFKDQKGLTIILASVGVMALFGTTALVTDFGRLALTRQQLVNAADSAALAGAHDLTFATDPVAGADNARQKALDTAIANGAPPNGIVVSIDSNKITVDIEKTVGLIMSKPFGINERNIQAHAAAMVTGVSSYRGVVPLAIKEQPLTYGQISTLKAGSPNSPGNFGALALAGKGSKNYKDNLINGFSEEVEIGENLSTEPGNMSGPTEGIDERLARCDHNCTYDNFVPNCPRIIVIPMYSNDTQGRDTITVTGFAAFFIDREATNSSSDEIKGYFVRMAADGAHDLLQPITGLYGATLIK